MTGLMTYQQAAESLRPMRVSHVTLRRAAAKNTPFEDRLRVVRMGHRTVGIRQSALDAWVARREGTI